MEKISIIIPVYNESDTIEECIESIFIQDYKNFEVIIIDASTDNTSYILKEYAKKYLNLKIIKAEKKNTAIQRNQGIMLSAGKHVFNMSGHAILPPGVLKKLKDALDRQPPSIAGVGCSLVTPESESFSERMIGKVFDTRMGGFGSTDQYANISEETKVMDSIAFVLYRKKILRRFLFDPAFPVGQDAELHYRMKTRGFKLLMISDAFIFHHKRKSYWKFWKQMERCGYYRAKIIKKHPESKRIVYFFPALFLVAGIVLFFYFLFYHTFLSILLFFIPLFLYYVLGFVSLLFESEYDLAMSFIAPFYYFAIHAGYGLGIIKFFGGIRI